LEKPRGVLPALKALRFEKALVPLAAAKEDMKNGKF
jgi:hypothetical protein